MFTRYIERMLQISNAPTASVNQPRSHLCLVLKKKAFGLDVFKVDGKDFRAEIWAMWLQFGQNALDVILQEEAEKYNCQNF